MRQRPRHDDVEPVGALKRVKRASPFMGALVAMLSPTEVGDKSSSVADEEEARNLKHNFITWDASGANVVIVDPVGFCKHVLPVYFNHQSLLTASPGS